MNKIIFKSPIGNMFITETNNELIEIGVLKGNEKWIALIKPHLYWKRQEHK